MTVDADVLRVRQNQLLSPKLRDIGALVFGAGMTGSWVVLGLARMLKRVDVWDFDRVSEENLGTQAYTQVELVDWPIESGGLGEEAGMFKVDALEAICDSLPVHGHRLKAPPSVQEQEKDEAIRELLAQVDVVDDRLDLSTSVVVCCVDTIEGRRECAEWAQAEKVPLFIDTRVLGEIAVIIPVIPDDTPGKVRCATWVDGNTMCYGCYLNDLPDPATVPDAPCGAVGTVFVGHWVASQVERLINNWANGQQLPGKVVTHVGQNREIIQPETS